jgi:hypothetical protein
VEIAALVIIWVSRVLELAGGALGLFVVVDAISRKPDSYVAADRQTKTVWVAITAGAAMFLLLGAAGTVVTALDLLWDAAMVGALVYLVDIRPRLRDVQRGTRW